MCDSRAYDEGKAAGTSMIEARLSGERLVIPKPPYRVGSPEEQDWRKGYESVLRVWKNMAKGALQKPDST